MKCKAYLLMIMLLAHAEVSRSGLEPNLRYVTKEDLDSNDVKEIAEGKGRCKFL